jgi:hypothetical protein
MKSFKEYFEIKLVEGWVNPAWDNATITRHAQQGNKDVQWWLVDHNPNLLNTMISSLNPEVKRYMELKGLLRAQK